MKIKPWMMGVAAVLIVGGALAWTKNVRTGPDAGVPGAVESATTTFREAEIEVPGSGPRVKLADGKASFEMAPGSAARGSVEVMDGMVATWKKDGRVDIAAVLAVQNGGSGTFYYLAVYDGSLVKKSEALLGDRIKVTRMGIGELVNGSADYRVTVQTLVRKEGEPFTAEPSVSATRTFYVEDQILKEVAPGRDDS
jgi:hypothetical protein